REQAGWRLRVLGDRGRLQVAFKQAEHASAAIAMDHAAWLQTLPGRRNPQNPPRRVVGCKPERAIGAGAHIADALVELAQEPLLRSDRVTADIKPDQDLPGERTHEQTAAPGWEQIARIERHAGRRDRGHPVFDWLLHAGLVRALVNLRPAVIDAVP